MSAILTLLMEYRKLLAGFGLLALAAASCTLPEPGGQAASEPRTEEPAVAAAPAGSMESEPGEPPAVVEQEPLSLRFVSPNIGPPAGGNEVTIDGAGFDAYPRVTFGGVGAWIRSVTATEIRVIVPAPEEPLAGGTLVVDVTVANPPAGSSVPVSQTLTRAYSYVDPDAGSRTAEEPPSGEAPAQVAEQDTDSDDGEQSEPAANPGPTLVASFSFEASTNPDSCPPATTGVRFTDRSTGGATGWIWDFGDGTLSREQHREHCYATAGMRSVTLTVSNAGGSASTSKIVTVGM